MTFILNPGSNNQIEISDCASYDVEPHVRICINGTEADVSLNDLFAAIIGLDAKYSRLRSREED